MTVLQDYLPINGSVKVATLLVLFLHRRKNGLLKIVLALAVPSGSPAEQDSSDTSMLPGSQKMLFSSSMLRGLLNLRKSSVRIKYRHERWRSSLPHIDEGILPQQTAVAQKGILRNRSRMVHGFIVGATEWGLGQEG